MRRAHATTGMPRHQGSLPALRAVCLFLTVPLFAAIVLSPVKDGLEEYEVFIGLWAPLALPPGVETARAGPMRRWPGLGLCIAAIAGLIMVLRRVAGDRPSGIAVLMVGTTLVTLGLICQVARPLTPVEPPRRR